MELKASPGAAVLDRVHQPRGCDMNKFFGKLVNRVFGKRKAKRARPTSRIAVEKLDSRDMMAVVTASVGADHVLRINGTNDFDQITVYENNGFISVSATANWVPQAAPIAPVPAASLSRIEINGFDGWDSINFTKITTGNVSLDALNLPVPVVMYGGSGNDIMQSTTIGPGYDFYPTPVTMFGGDGADELRGGNGNDQLHGDAGNDRLYGGGGNDQLGAYWVGSTWMDDPGNDVMRAGWGNDALGGGTGNDVLFGDDGNDTIWGDDGDDQLWGGAGVDDLHGQAGDDWMDAGSAGEYANGGGQVYDFNAYYWTQNGTSYDDILQGQSNTCWVVTGLAEAAYRGVDLKDYISYQGNGVYRVFWKPDYAHGGMMVDGHGQTYEDVHFTGRTGIITSDYGIDNRLYPYYGTDAAIPATTVSGAHNGESWVILYQRAILQQANRAWDNPGSGGCYWEPPLYVGLHSTEYSGSNMTLSNLMSAVDNHRCVEAITNSDATKITDPSLVNWHWYSVQGYRIASYTNIYTNFGTISIPNYNVDLYDPHGKLVSVSWSNFASSMVAFDVQ
jgi:hypothetical protein